MEINASETSLVSQLKSVPMLGLADVYREHGPETGWAELQRRSVCPPTPHSEKDLDTEVRQEIGHLSVTADYVELDH
ncbi:MAG: hypothetical protein ABIQ89_01880 [Candidatus Saccharimonadales bacterium]